MARVGALHGSCSTWGEDQDRTASQERTASLDRTALTALHSPHCLTRPDCLNFALSIVFIPPQFATHPIIGNQIKLPKIGLVDINLYREIPNGFKIKGIRVVSRCRGAKWFVVITIQASVSVPDNPPFGRAIGVDVGLIDLLATS